MKPETQPFIYVVYLLVGIVIGAWVGHKSRQSEIDEIRMKDQVEMWYLHDISGIPARIEQSSGRTEIYAPKLRDWVELSSAGERDLINSLPTPTPVK